MPSTVARRQAADENKKVDHAPKHGKDTNTRKPLTDWVRGTDSGAIAEGPGRFLSTQDLDDIVGDKYKETPEHGGKKDSKKGDLLGGDSVLNILEDLMGHLGGLFGGGEDDSDEETVITDKSNDKSEDNPFEVLDDSDFDDSDDTVQEFKNLGGPKQVVKVIRIHGAGALPHLAALSQRLREVQAKSQPSRSANRTAALRVAYSQIQATLRGDGAEHQLAAIRHLDTLAVGADTLTERDAILAARSSVLRGSDEHLDAAAYRIKKIVASRTPADPVVLRMADGSRPKFGRRVAYTNLETQGGEGYLLCPKGLTELGHAVPMEISKCREHCVDSRTSREGETTCHFGHWLKVAADSNANVMARLEVLRNPDNDLTLITLAAGERSRPIKAGEAIQPYETQFEERHLHKNTGEGTSKLDREGFDAWLASAKPTEGGQHGDVDDTEKNPGLPMYEPRTASKKQTLDPDSNEGLGKQVEKANAKKPFGDEGIEALLTDERDVFDDDEFDILEQMLAAKRGNKK